MPQGGRSQETSLGAVGVFSSPRALEGLPDIALEGFDCGEPSLNEWLAKRARKSEGLSARTYIVVNNNEIAAYYCISAGSVIRDHFPSKTKRNMPDPIPVMILGRLAVATKFQGLGLGKDLLRHSLIQTISVSEIIGCRALLIHSLNDRSTSYYERLGFLKMHEIERTVFMPIETIKASFS